MVNPLSNFFNVLLGIFLALPATIQYFLIFVIVLVVIAGVVCFLK